MTENKDGLYFAWFTGGKDHGCFFTKSTNNGESFAPRDSISALGSHPQLAALATDDMMVVWDESVKVNDKFYKRIGIQKRGIDGSNEGKNYLTQGTLTASYPVIAPLKRNESLIAYFMKKGDKDYIVYNVVNWHNQ